MDVERKMSDEGYNSEESGRKSPPIEKLSGRSDSRRIALENKEFKEKYKIEKILNNSANGVIYEGKRVFDGLPVCVKQVPKSRISDWGSIEGRKVPKEFEMHLKATKSQGVVQVYDFYERKTSWVLIMEKPPNSSDLFEVSRRCGAIKEDPARIIFRQLVQSTLELHQLGVLHRDLKDENCLIDTETLQMKIIDFGCATEYDDQNVYTRMSGTPEFFAPEIFGERGYRAESSTVWTLGTLLYVILLGDIPFETTDDILKGNRQMKEFEVQLSANAQNLLNSLLSANAENRPTLLEICAHPWLHL